MNPQLPSLSLIFKILPYLFPFLSILIFSSMVKNFTRFSVDFIRLLH